MKLKNTLGFLGVLIIAFLIVDVGIPVIMYGFTKDTITAIEMMLFGQVFLSVHIFGGFALAILLSWWIHH